MAKRSHVRRGFRSALSLLFFLVSQHGDCLLSRSVSSRAALRRSGCRELNASAHNYVSFDSVKRVFCISDLHTDSAENMAWLEEKCIFNKEEDGPGKGDVLIVAGDISHDMITFQTTLRLLLTLECHVFFVPGNHEAWLSPRSKNHRTSLDKLSLVEQACRHMGVHTDCTLVGSENEHPLWIVPLQSWYDGSLSIEGCEEFCQGFGRWPWTDFLRCRWPTDEFPLLPKTDANARIPLGLNQHFLEWNEDAVDTVREHPASSVMTVSHFLPNSQCLPDWKDVDSPIFLRDEWLDHGAPETSAKFAKVAGSSALDEQIRSLLDLSPSRSRLLHVFGHSHRPKDIEYNNVRYIHNPLGKPRERNMRMVSPNVDFQLVWDTRSGEVPGERIVRYWEQFGGGKEMLKKRLKEHRRQRTALLRQSR